MPFNADFSKLQNLQTIEINPNGWVNPIYVEYGISDEDLPKCYWRVKGTQHTFTISIVRLDFLSEGNYKTHFNDVLEIFKEDYLAWKKEGFNTDWSREYQQQYFRFIII